MPEHALQKADKTRINRGRRYLLWHKVGCDMQLCTVEVCSDMYKREIGVGKSDYVDVFGFGIKKFGVNVNKLRERV